MGEPPPRVRFAARYRRWLLDRTALAPEQVDRMVALWGDDLLPRQPYRRGLASNSEEEILKFIQSLARPARSGGPADPWAVKNEGPSSGSDRPDWNDARAKRWRMRQQGIDPTFGLKLESTLENLTEVMAGAFRNLNRLKPRSDGDRAFREAVLAYLVRAFPRVFLAREMTRYGDYRSAYVAALFVEAIPRDVREGVPTAKGMTSSLPFARMMLALSQTAVLLNDLGPELAEQERRSRVALAVTGRAITVEVLAMMQAIDVISRDFAVEYRAEGRGPLGPLEQLILRYALWKIVEAAADNRATRLEVIIRTGDGTIEVTLTHDGDLSAADYLRFLERQNRKAAFVGDATAYAGNFLGWVSAAGGRLDSRVDVDGRVTHSLRLPLESR
jgi:hypothetical protein